MPDPALNNPPRIWRARSPFDISLRGWRQIAARAAARWGPSHIVLIAGGVSFFVILSAGPALATLVSFYALVTSPGAASQHAQVLRDVLPADAALLFEDFLVSLVSARPGPVALGLAVSLAVTLWTANSGMRQYCAALTIVQAETVKRPLVSQIGVSFALTLGAIFIFAAAGLVVAVLPAALDTLRLGGRENAIYAAHWIVLTALSAAYGAVIYRYGPDRTPAAWRWVLPGAVLAALSWAVMSNVFALILRGFEGFSRLYGPLAGVVTMMLWVFFSTLIFLLGGLVNAEAERQTVRDTTAPPEKPISERGAVPADEIGPHPDIKALRRSRL